jgi:hypothetical protein
VIINVFANDVAGADGVDIDNNPAVKVSYVADSLTGGTGSVTYNNNGTFTYHPATGESGTISFQYQIVDGDGDADTATVTFTIAPDSAPTVTATDLTVDEQGLTTGTGELADGIAGNNSDTSETSSSGSLTIGTGGDTLGKVEIQASNGSWIDVTAATVGVPILVTGTHGTLSVTSSGGVYSYTYTLTSNYTTHPDNIVDGDGIEGAADPLAGDAFAVRVSDNEGDVTSSTPAATSVINVTVLDDAPIANDDTVAGTQPENADVIINVFANDVAGADGVDIDNNPAVKVSYVAGSLTGGTGTVTYNNNGTFTYHPAT